MNFNEYEIFYAKEVERVSVSKLEEGIKAAKSVVISLGSIPLEGGHSHV